MADKKPRAPKRDSGPRRSTQINRGPRDAAPNLPLRTARLLPASGQVENKKFSGAPKQQLFSYRKGEHGNIIGRHYFDLDPDQDLQSSIVSYTEVVGPEPQ